jgi:hypothetical protein
VRQHPLPGHLLQSRRSVDNGMGQGCCDLLTLVCESGWPFKLAHSAVKTVILAFLRCGMISLPLPLCRTHLDHGRIVRVSLLDLAVSVPRVDGRQAGYLLPAAERTARRLFGLLRLLLLLDLPRIRHRTHVSAPRLAAPIHTPPDCRTLRRITLTRNTCGTGLEPWPALVPPASQRSSQRGTQRGSPHLVTLLVEAQRHDVAAARERRARRRSLRRAVDLHRGREHLGAHLSEQLPPPSGAVR